MVMSIPAIIVPPLLRIALSRLERTALAYMKTNVIINKRLKKTPDHPGCLNDLQPREPFLPLS